MPTITVIGASADRTKVGNRCVRAYLQQGGTVYPVNPCETANAAIRPKCRLA